MKALKDEEIRKNWEIIWTSNPLCIWNRKYTEVRFKFIVRLVKNRLRDVVRVVLIIRDLKTKELYSSSMFSIKLNITLLKIYYKYKGVKVKFPSNKKLYSSK